VKARKCFGDAGSWRVAHARETEPYEVLLSHGVRLARIRNPEHTESVAGHALVLGDDVPAKLFIELASFMSDLHATTELEHVRRPSLDGNETTLAVLVKRIHPRARLGAIAQTSER
jgi:hypothetical protein